MPREPQQSRAEDLGDELDALMELNSLAKAAREAGERSAGCFNLLVLAPICRDGEPALARIVWCNTDGWVARYYERGKRLTPTECKGDWD